MKIAQSASADRGETKKMQLYRNIYVCFACSACDGHASRSGGRQRSGGGLPIALLSLFAFLLVGISGAYYPNPEGLYTYSPHAFFLLM
jgi:hypothetical protein